MNRDDALEPGTAAWSAALAGVSGHGFSGHGHETPGLSQGEFVQESANSISSADAIIGFQQGGGENFLCADLEQGRATWINTSYPEKSTSFVPPGGLEGYVERAIRDRMDESPRAIRDDIGLTTETLQTTLTTQETATVNALDIGPSVPTVSVPPAEAPVAALDLGPSAPPLASVDSTEEVFTLDVGGDLLPSEPSQSSGPQDFEGPSAVDALEVADTEQDFDFEPGGKA